MDIYSNEMSVGGTWCSLPLAFWTRWNTRSNRLARKVPLGKSIRESNLSRISLLVSPARSLACALFEDYRRVRAGCNLFIPISLTWSANRQHDTGLTCQS
ncbi:hypothetical protein SBC1_74360 (plasmid) [Caballeronia sp. SBC1]|nr:hypothetical protein SBC2_71930 [Caballeronia sp. SBC2]QIN67389.1 hypothetical protein SBC1_74360 [Caballeronia sp. SBC1]